jgi:hypothetical protein
LPTTKPEAATRSSRSLSRHRWAGAAASSNQLDEPRRFKVGDEVSRVQIAPVLCE